MRELQQGGVPTDEYDGPVPELWDDDDLGQPDDYVHVHELVNIGQALRPDRGWRRVGDIARELVEELKARRGD